MVCPLETDGYTSCVHIGGYEGQAMSFYPDKTSPYTTKHRGLPTFRIRIPADLQPCLGKTEYRRSIGRCYAPKAKLRALRLATAALEVFSLTREALQARRPEGLTHSHETGKGNTGKNGSGYTPLREYRGISQVAQDASTNSNGYTSDLQGRTLASLTNDEIRSIADEWLLAALQGSNAFALRMAHVRQDTRMIKNAAEVEFHTEADATTAGKIKALYQTDLRAHRMNRIAKATDSAYCIARHRKAPANQSFRA